MKSTILQLIEKHKLISILSLCNILRNATHNEVVEHLQQLQSEGEIIKIDNCYRFPTEEEKQRWSNFQNWLDAGKEYTDADTRIELIYRFLNRK